MIKKLSFLAAPLVFTGLSLFAAAPASDNAADSAYNDGWQTGDNGGAGFGAWTLANPSNNSGFFVGSSTGNGGGSGGIDTGGRSWGMYANSGDTATANRNFSSNLASGETFTIQMDNGFVNTGGSVGFNLLNSSGTDRFTFEFTGGSTNYTYNTGSNNSTDTGVGYTTNGLTISFTLNTSNGFTLSVTPNGGSTTVLTGTLASSDISQFQLFNSNAGSGSSFDAFFNNASVVPEPSTLALLGGSSVLGASFFLRRRRKN